MLKILKRRVFCKKKGIYIKLVLVVLTFIIVLLRVWFLDKVILQVFGLKMGGLGFLLILMVVVVVVWILGYIVSQVMSFIKQVLFRSLFRVIDRVKKIIFVIAFILKKVGVGQLLVIWYLMFFCKKGLFFSFLQIILK